VKRFKILWFIPLLLLANLSHGEVVDRIVAIVNDEVITLSDLNGAFEPYRKRIVETYRGQAKEGLMAEARMSFLNRLIDTILIDQEAKKNGISIKEEEVMAAINDIMAQKKLSLEDAMRELATQGISYEAYKKEIREQLIKMRLVRREIKSKIMVTEGEIGEYYRKHREDYEGKEAVRIRQIFLAFPVRADAEAKDKLRKDAENLVARLKAGESFEILASSYSQGPTAGGGDLGFIEKGMVHPEVEAVAFRLAIGAVSGVIPSRAGFHIIQVVDRRGGGLQAIEAVREEIQMRIEDEKMGKKFEEWMGQLRKRSHIEIKL